MAIGCRCRPGSSGARDVGGHTHDLSDVHAAIDGQRQGRAQIEQRTQHPHGLQHRCLPGKAGPMRVIAGACGLGQFPEPAPSIWRRRLPAAPATTAPRQVAPPWPRAQVSAPASVAFRTIPARMDETMLAPDLRRGLFPAIHRCLQHHSPVTWESAITVLRTPGLPTRHEHTRAACRSPSPATWRWRP